MEFGNTVQEAVIKTMPKRNKCKKAKVFGGDLYKQLRKEEKLKAKEKRRDNKHLEISNIRPSFSMQMDKPSHPLNVRTLGLVQLKLVYRNSSV